MTTTPQLSASAEVTHAGVLSAMERLKRDHEDYALDVEGAGRWAFETPYGSLSAEMRREVLHATASAPDDTSLCYMKMMLTDHLAEYLGEMPRIDWRGHGSEITLPPFLREIAVTESRRLTPHMQRVTFTGEKLARFGEKGIHVRLLFPNPGRKPVWPTLGRNGSLVWPAGDDALTARVYTIREIDVATNRVAIDFVLHDGDRTPAADWAQSCKPGDRIGMLGPGGGDTPDTGNILLAGDDTALPAIGRMLEQLPVSARVTVLIEIDGPDDEMPLKSAASLDIRWLHRNGREPGTAGLLPAALRKMDSAGLPDDLFVWAGCEFSDFCEIRALVRKGWRLPRARHMVVSYWRRGLAGFAGDDHEHGTDER